MRTLSDPGQLESIREEFKEQGIEVIAANVRRFPNETIFIFEVTSDDFEKALRLANEITDKVQDGFVTIKRALRGPKASEANGDAISDLWDPKVSELIELLNARSRTSEQQPSIQYIKDAASWLSVCIAPRHNLIFGRRGVGKTALMLEAKRQVDQRGDTSFWMNVQTLRSLDANGAFLNVVLRLCDLPITAFAQRDRAPLSVNRSRELRHKVSQ